MSPTSTKSTDTSSSDRKSQTTTPEDKSKQEEDGSISRLREERRDLYDLLYGDEDDVGRRVNGDNVDLQPVLPGNKGIPIGSSSVSTLLGGDDDDLDDFDPYGLQT